MIFEVVGPVPGNPEHETLRGLSSLLRACADGAHALFADEHLLVSIRDRLGGSLGSVDRAYVERLLSLYSTRVAPLASLPRRLVVSLESDPQGGVLTVKDGRISTLALPGVLVGESHSDCTVLSVLAHQLAKVPVQFEKRSGGGHSVAHEVRVTHASGRIVVGIADSDRAHSNDEERQTAADLRVAAGEMPDWAGAGLVISARTTENLVPLTIYEVALPTMGNRIQELKKLKELSPIGYVFHNIKKGVSCEDVAGWCDSQRGEWHEYLRAQSGDWRLEPLGKNALKAAGERLETHGLGAPERKEVDGCPIVQEVVSVVSEYFVAADELLVF